MKSIEADKGQLVRILGPIEAGQVLICFRSRIHFLDLFRGQVYDMNGNQCIFFSCLGVLKLVVLRIEWSPSLHVELWHIAFVKSDKGNFFAVWGPFEGLSHGELLLIHPVCSPVDDPVGFPIEGKLGDAVGSEIGHIQVIVFDKSYLIVVRRKGSVGDFFSSHQLLLLPRC